MARAAKKGAPAPEPRDEAPIAVAPVDAPPAAPVETPAADTPDAPPAAVLTPVTQGTVTHVVVTALQPVRWRAGRKFTAEPTVILLEDLGEGELAAVEADPLLSVKVVQVPA